MTHPPPSDSMHVVAPCAAGLAVHKLRITASTRLCADAHSQPQCATREFAASPAGLAELTAWLDSEQVEAVAMEGTGVYWECYFPDYLSENRVFFPELDCRQNCWESK